MITETFSVRFHQPFLVRSGLASGGLDAVARIDSPIPASSVKGAFRGVCAYVLHVKPELVDEIFGQADTRDAAGRSAWAWTDPGPQASFTPQVRARNRVDASTGVTQPEALTLSEEWWQNEPDEAFFAVEQVAVLEQAQLERHRAILQVAAYAVTALGSWRNRGMGTVTVRPLEPFANLAQRWAEVTR